MLMRHAARHHFADKVDAEAPAAELAPRFLGEVAARIADTAGAWMAAGFVHGVLNTDNFNITGESFDYGPWRFLPNFDFNFTAAYFDNAGRYAYGRQPEASLWAVCRLADCLVPFGGSEPLEAALQDFYPRLEDSLQSRLCWRLGVSATPEQGQAIARALFAAARDSEVPFAQILHDWYGGARRRGAYDGTAWQALADSLDGASRLPQADDPMFDTEAAPALAIERVEALWAPIAEADDWAPLYEALDEIRAWGAAWGGAGAGLHRRQRTREHVAHDKAAFHPQNMRKRRQLFGVQAPEIADIAGRDAKDVVALAGNQETGQNLRDIRRRGLELGQHFGRLTLKRDLHQNQHFMAEP